MTAGLGMASEPPTEARMELMTESVCDETASTDHRGLEARKKKIGIKQTKREEIRGAEPDVVVVDCVTRAWMGATCDSGAKMMNAGS